MGQSGTVPVQVWTVHGVCAANRPLQQWGRQPFNGRVLAGAPAATVELKSSGDAWEEFAVRALSAAGLQGDLESFVFLDAQACYAEIGTNHLSRTSEQSTASSSKQRVRPTEGPRDAKHRMAAAVFGASISKQLHGIASQVLGAEIAVPFGVGRILAVPLRRQMTSRGPSVFLWVKAFAPQLQLLGAFLFGSEETLVDFVNRREHGDPEVLRNSLADGGVGGRDVEWWREDVSMRRLERLDTGALVSALGLRSGQVLIAHPANPEQSCEELYAAARELSRTEARASEMQARASSQSVRRSSAQGGAGLPAQVLAGLPARRFALGDAGETSCQICLESFVEGTLLKSLPCLHSFHAHCIDEWLCHSASCPVCRNPVTLSS